MKIPSHLSILVVALAAALALSACGKAQDAAPAASAMVASTSEASTAAVSIVTVDLGSTIGADNNVEAVGESFAPTDHIYATVVTSGVGAAKLGVKWTDSAGQSVKKDGKSITGAGRDATTFEVDQPNGFAVGRYQLEVTLNDAPAIRKSFAVR